MVYDQFRADSYLTKQISHQNEKLQKLEQNEVEVAFQPMVLAKTSILNPSVGGETGEFY